MNKSLCICTLHINLFDERRVYRVSCEKAHREPLNYDGIPWEMIPNSGKRLGSAWEASGRLTEIGKGCGTRCSRWNGKKTPLRSPDKIGKSVVELFTEWRRVVQTCRSDGVVPMQNETAGLVVRLCVIESVVYSHRMT